MTTVIDPKVRVIDYGPTLTIEDEKDGEITITPDEEVWGAGQVTYKGVQAVRATEIKVAEANSQTEEAIARKMRESIISSVGAGHASMATTPGMWIEITDSSKLVDSIFTPMRFASSLMPSGRRVPISLDAIAIPKGIQATGDEATSVYLQTSEANIKAYEKLQERGVEKQDASKIVQYGHQGGGFMFLPLETLVSLKKRADMNGADMPREGREIISQLVDYVHANGMGTVFESRYHAPRTSCPNPDIFHSRKTEAQELIESNYRECVNSPAIVGTLLPRQVSAEHERRLKEYFKLRDRILIDPNAIKSGEWRRNLELANLLNEDFTAPIISTITNSSWRVWGEVKRHRTLSQIAESIYSAAQRGLTVAREAKYFEASVDFDKNFRQIFENSFYTPESVKANPENLGLWFERFQDSMLAYQRLTEMGVPKSDAIAVVPRGLRLGVIKQFDAYNRSTGYMSLRLCKTSEPEMQQTTEQERDLFMALPETVLSPAEKALMIPKCGYVGFCPDGKYCSSFAAPRQSPEFYTELAQKRKAFILNAINDE